MPMRFRAGGGTFGARTARGDQSRHARRYVGHCGAVDFVEGTLAIGPHPHQPRLDENLQVLRHCRLGEIKAADHFLAAAAVACRQMLQDFQARRMRKRAEPDGKPFGGYRIGWHLV